ncbi:MAG: hypothetical protein GY719_26720 [bacterium]|nr:hypothetical protein [bacterium]
MKRLRDGNLALAGLVIALLAVTAPVASAREFRVDVRLQPADGIGLEELAVLSIQVELGGGRRADPSPEFELDNFRVAAGPSTSNSLRFVNGATSRSLTFTWHLQPLSVGTARVHSGVLRVEGEQVELPERSVEVLEVAPPRHRRRDPFRPPFSSGSLLDEREDSPDNFFNRRRRRQDPRPVTPPKIFLRAEADPKDPYVGEQVLYTLYLYTQADVRSVNPEELPDFKGFWARVVPQPDQLEPKMVYMDGERIGKVVLLQRALFPRRGGRIEVEPVSARLAAMMPDSGPFGSLLPRTREIVRMSNPLSLDVRPLPAAPAGFRGAVGRLQLAAELSPREIEVGEAATLTLTLEGRGHLQGLAAPLLPELPGIKVFPPQQQSNESVEQRSVSGQRTWSFVLVPERAGHWQLPPIDVPFFDPRREKFLAARTAGLDLTVRGSTRLAHEDGQTVALHPVRTAALPALGGGESNAHLWLFSLPWGLAAIVFLARRRSTLGRRGGGHRGNGRRTERKRLLERLRGAAGEARPRRAAAEIEEAWREYLHDRWDLPQGSPSTRWGHLLTQRGARREAAEKLVTLADDLHYLRYAPKLSSTAEMRRELVERSRKLARAMG